MRKSLLQRNLNLKIISFQIYKHSYTYSDKAFKGTDVKVYGKLNKITHTVPLRNYQRTLILPGYNCCLDFTPGSPDWTVRLNPYTHFSTCTGKDHTTLRVRAN